MLRVEAYEYIPSSVQQRLLDPPYAASVAVQTLHLVCTRVSENLRSLFGCIESILCSQHVRVRVRVRVRVS